MSQKLNAEKIKEFLEAPLAVTVFEETDSTNAEAKRRIREGLKVPALFLAEHQTAGRGRLGRSFYSPENTGIYMTLAWPVAAGATDFLRITAKTAVAVVRGIQARLNAALQIKWVNDIYFGNRKICGILVETVSVPAEIPDEWQTWLVIGIGVNVSTKDFPAELSGKAGSLGAENCDRNALVSSMTTELLWELENLQDTSYLELYRNASNVLGKQVMYGAGEDFSMGLAKEIDDTGALLIEKEDGHIERLFTGEISVRFTEP